MKAGENIKMAMENLWRTKLRTTLTVIGVIIGIAALTSMVSFGTGLERNITKDLTDNDLFTSLNVFSTNGRNFDRKKDTSKIKIALNDSLLDEIRAVPGVQIVYPSVAVPVKLKLDTLIETAYATGIPTTMAAIKPYNELSAGKFFSSDSAREIILSPDVLRKLGLEVMTKAEMVDPGFKKDTLLKPALADTLVGKEIDLITMTLNTEKLDPLSMMMGGGMNNMVTENVQRFKIVGIGATAQKFAGPGMQQVILPLKTTEALNGASIGNAMDYLEGRNGRGSYSSAYVKVDKVQDLDSLKSWLKTKNIPFFAFSDNLEEVKKVFIVLDSILGIVGFISLLVASFGIINTMLMSILERRREIGIMKAVGGSDADIRKIFFFEAGFIGLIGALGGLLLGWLMTRVANLVMNAKIHEFKEKVELFYFPPWLLIGSVLFAIGVSLLAGMYPAIKASKVNPVEALRQD